jgi:hypothetical protein
MSDAIRPGNLPIGSRLPSGGLNMSDNNLSVLCVGDTPPQNDCKFIPYFCGNPYTCSREIAWMLRFLFWSFVLDKERIAMARHILRTRWRWHGRRGPVSRSAHDSRPVSIGCLQLRRHQHSQYCGSAAKVSRNRQELFCYQCMVLSQSLKACADTVEFALLRSESHQKTRVPPLFSGARWTKFR